MTQELAQVETPIGAFRAVVGDGIVRTAGFVKTNGVRRDSRGNYLIAVRGFAAPRGER